MGKPLIVALALEIFQNAFIQINLALRPRRQRERQKRIGLMSKKPILHMQHTFFTFFAVTARLKRLRNSRMGCFIEDRKTHHEDIFFLLLNLGSVHKSSPGNSCRRHLN